MLTAAQVTAIGSVIRGTAGADVLTGSSLADTILGMGGNDTITDSGGDDTLDGGAGDDLITDSGYGTNTLRGGDGNDQISSSNGATNLVEGGAGNDLMINSGAISNNVTTFNGGAGDDRMVGGLGGSTYVINRGDGVDTILDDHTGYAVANKLVFGANIVAADLEFSRTGDHLVIKIKDAQNAAATDQVTVEKWFTTGGGFQLDQLQFSDGTSLTNVQIAQLGSANSPTTVPQQHVEILIVGTLNGWLDAIM